jgi:hypothetical protein
VNFFINWLKKDQDSNKKFKHDEQSLETLLSVDDNGCCKTEKAEAPKPKPVAKKAPVAKKPSTAKKVPSKLEQVKADAERMAKKPAPKKPKAK